MDRVQPELSRLTLSAPEPSKELPFTSRVRSSPRLDSQPPLPLERRKRSFVAGVPGLLPRAAPTPRVLHRHLPNAYNDAPDPHGEAVPRREVRPP